MSRSPLAYPLTRGIDGDSGGAADLQTDIMRFMAILSLCLVAIFALVQSMPIAPETPVIPATDMTPPTPAASMLDAAPLQPVKDPSATTPQPNVARVEKSAPPAEYIQLTRPKWTPANTQAPITNPTPIAPPVETPTDAQLSVAKTATVSDTEPAPGPAPAEEGFTLRFESDIVLTRLVAAGQVGFYAIDANRAQRMAVSDSRISFWEASTPNAFHEMEAATVPQAVVDALHRTGAEISSVNFGVTLPARLSQQLDRLMSEHRGGALVIATDGNLKLDGS